MTFDVTTAKLISLDAAAVTTGTSIKINFDKEAQEAEKRGKLEEYLALKDLKR